MDAAHFQLRDLQTDVLSARSGWKVWQFTGGVLCLLQKVGTCLGVFHAYNRGCSRKGNLRQIKTWSHAEGWTIFRAPAAAGSELALGCCLGADSAAVCDGGH